MNVSRPLNIAAATYACQFERMNPWIDALPSKATMKAAIETAMLDLQAYVDHWSAEETVPMHVQREASTILAGIIYLNGYAGRCKEWQSMTSAHVRQQIAKGLDYLVCHDYKTAPKYASLGNYK